jgi:hypothetical protein
MGALSAAHYLMSQRNQDYRERTKKAQKPDAEREMQEEKTR